MTAPDQLRSLVDRILRLKEEQDALATDIREVYAEVKSAGFDKAALGQVVQHLRRVAKDAKKVEEAQAVFDLYLNAYHGDPSHTPAYAREAAE